MHSVHGETLRKNCLSDPTCAACLSGEMLPDRTGCFAHGHSLVFFGIIFTFVGGFGFRTFNFIGLKHTARVKTLTGIGLCAATREQRKQHNRY
jgi:hypothetical protein